MVKRTRHVLTLALLLVAPCTLAPTCAGAGDAPAPEEQYMIVCSEEGQPLGMGVPGAGEAIGSCYIQVKKFDGCDCWETQDNVLLAIPPSGLDLHEGMDTCAEQAAMVVEGITSDTGVVIAQCELLGYYTPPSGKPNATPGPVPHLIPGGGGLASLAPAAAPAP